MMKFIYGFGSGVLGLMLCLILEAPPVYQDRDAWLVLQCGAPIAVLFVSPEGKVEAHPITNPGQLKPLALRAKAAQFKYSLTLDRRCEFKMEGV